MQVFIMRHGEAEMFAASDSDRSLNQSGITEVAKMATYLAGKIEHLDYVLVSPYLRAQQTWQGLAAVLPKATNIVEMTELTPSGDEAAVVSLISELALEQPNANLLVISHLPLVGYLVEGLAADAGAPLFSTAAVAQVEVAPENRFISLLHPVSL
ncbi:phosphohistidine phosphatase SixA [Agarivorans sp. MS3-6]|uniref:phosphohistidine phosphatase SixA n=1 Tax=Agarivorans sp. TSD2052 TaxID=2937286 RepID=UPI00200FDD46|nr:phosphohistidine phosphatase SixA [Agarivorans sp. TSD2052]UPW20214.1 phosphohistidine phosphatase SixA [Agarivorans sp. TSD2052]